MIASFIRPKLYYVPLERNYYATMQSTTFIAVIFVLIQGIYPQGGIRYQIAISCIKQTGVDREAVEQAMAGNIPENDIKYKEFLACSYKQQGYLSENGQILIENVKKFLQDYYAPSDLTVLNNCTNFNETNHAATAYNAMRCIIGHLKNMKELEDQ